MATSDDFVINEEWFGPTPDEILKNIKEKAKKDLRQVNDTINELDEAVRICESLQRKNIALCPRCRVTSTYSYTDSVDEKKESASNRYQKNTKNKQHASLVAQVKTLFKSPVNHSTLSSSKKSIRNGTQSSSNVDMSFEDFQLALNAKNTAIENFQNKAESEKKDYETEIEKKEEENAQLKSRVSSAESENEKLKKENAKLKEDNARLNSSLTSTFCELEQLQKAEERAVLDAETANKDIRILSEEFKASQKLLTEEITNQKTQLSKLEEQINTLKNELITKDEELCMVKKELVEAKRPRVKDFVLGIRTERSGMGKTMIEMVTRELTRQLQNLLTKENITLTVKPCQSTADVPKGLLAVPCLTMSRVGTNIKDALTGIKVNRDVFVIVFHHTSKENLPSLTPTSLRITGSELRQLGAIIDMVFSSESGIYECDLNSTSVANIAALISKYS